MTTHKIIYAWGDSPDSITGQWSANTFYDESAEPYVPLAALERERRNARNEAIEAVAAKVAIYMLGRNKVFADRVVASVRAMKEPEE